MGHGHLQHSVQVIELHASDGGGGLFDALVRALALRLEVVSVAIAAPIVETEA